MSLPHETDTPNRALGACDTVQRLLNESGVGWCAGGPVPNQGPLCAKLYMTADDGKTVRRHVRGG